MKSLDFPNCKLEYNGFQWVVLLPKEYQGITRHFSDTLHEKNITNLRCRLNTPFKPRTTGKNSQNHKYYGNLRAIQYQSGANSLDVVHNYVKQYAVENLGFPEKIYLNRSFPKSEADCTIEEESLLIEATILIANEFGYTLPEVNNEIR